ncbi:rhodanese-like domain-containing protein [Afifella sp. IM 167]|uniref:rhodanese-like domain-containing protein n=1 Tax=Afifella sp. IM 167 TaxID=2033586 RepID=UPI001CCFEE04|nr:rhodanese-like domain-containing protein [Afifella sp. IM 167]MBZ8132540.1 rhodanese [Afifella sp. IM 167]
MAQTITKGYRQLLQDAETSITNLTPEEAIARRDAGEVVLIDLRDIRELKREGTIPGAEHCPRGMLEFWIDPESPYHKPVFSEDKTFIFFCAAGWRSALATRTAQEMGLSPVAHIVGGFAAWKEAGGEVEAPAPKPQKGAGGGA